MDIDKFYRLVGTTVRGLWYKFVKRPVRTFNVENRAHKVIEKRKAAPWHETTKQRIEMIKKEGKFMELNRFNPELVDRLKQVKVVSATEQQQESEEDKKHKFPKERFGAPLPYSFYKSDTVPAGKINAIDAYEMLIRHQEEKTSSQDLAITYSLDEDDVSKIIKYVSAVNLYKISQSNPADRFFKMTEEYKKENRLIAD